MQKIDMNIGELLSLLKRRSKRIEKTIDSKYFEFNQKGADRLKGQIKEIHTLLDAIETEVLEICDERAKK